MNGYFRLIHEEGKTCIQLIPPAEGGDAVSVNDVTEISGVERYYI